MERMSIVGRFVSKSLCASALVLLLSSCATLITSDKHYLEISTGEVRGASCDLIDSNGERWYVESTPDSLVVEGSSRAITVSCSKRNYETVVRQIESTINPLLLGNALFYPVTKSFISGLYPSLTTTWTYSIVGGVVAGGLLIDLLTNRDRVYTNKVELTMELESRKESGKEGRSPSPLSVPNINSTSGDRSGVGGSRLPAGDILILDLDGQGQKSNKQ